MANTVTKEISYEDLKDLLGKSRNLVLVDVRSEQEVAQGRIPGCINIPLETVESAFTMNPDDFKTKYGVTKPPLDAQELVFYCRTGRRAGSATQKAYHLGYVNARNYVGSFEEWSHRERK